MFRLIIFFPLFCSNLGNPAPRLKGLASFGILGGDNAVIGQLPYSLNLKCLGIHVCGAALISKKVALTAAHCTHRQNPDTFSISAGTIKLKDKGVWIRVNRVKEHPDYKNDTYDFDISILFLRKELELGKTIATIGLPNADYVLPDRALATVSGWGMYKNTGGKQVDHSEDLKFLNVPIWTKWDCGFFTHKLKSSVYCGGVVTGEENACAGDSGGPLVYKNKLVGLVSFGYGCGNKNVPVIYTNVASHRNWITKITGI